MNETTTTTHAYLLVKDAEGESADKDHTKWIESLGYNWELAHPSAEVGRLARWDFIVYKRVDAASPILMIQCAKGTVYGSIKFEIVRVEGDRKPLITFELENAKITKLKSRTDYRVNGESTAPQEEVHFACDRMFVTYTAVDPDKKGAYRSIVQGWDFRKNNEVKKAANRA